MTMHEIFQITDTCRIIVEPDEGTEDPRTWDPEVDCLQFHMPWLDTPDDLGDCQTTLGTVFTIVWGNHGDKGLALKVAKRYKRMFDVTESIAVEQITGYSQGDWAEVVCVTPEGHGDPEGHIKTFRNWRFGNVYIVSVERRQRYAKLPVLSHTDSQGLVLDHAHPVVTDEWEEVESLGGVYPDDEWIDEAEAKRTVREFDMAFTSEEREALGIGPGEA